MGETASLIVAVVSLVLAGLGGIARRTVIARLRGGFAFVGVALFARWGVLVGHMGVRWEMWSHGLALLAIGYLVAQVFLLFVFEWLLARRVGITVPRLARDVAALFLYLLIAAGALRIAGIEVTALLATSAVLTAVIGLAMQETLGTLLAGLALAWEQKVATGVWVEIDGVVGEVEELGWRTLSLRTRLGELFLLPNSHVVKARVRVLGDGHEAMAVPVRLGVAYSAPPYAVKETLARLAHDVPGVVSEPAPQILVREFADNAVIYECRLWTREPWRAADIHDALFTAAHAALRRAGMEIPFPQRIVHTAPPQPATDAAGDCRRALERCALFSGLPEDGLAVLAATAHWHVFAPAESVVRQGDASRALFVIAEGEAGVLHDGVEIATVGSGDVFGEMAFLSGDPRAATVRAKSPLAVVDVDTHALHALLAEHRELADLLAERMAARQQVLAARQELAAQPESPRGLAAFLRERLLRLVAD